MLWCRLARLSSTFRSGIENKVARFQIFAGEEYVSISVPSAGLCYALMLGCFVPTRPSATSVVLVRGPRICLPDDCFGAPSSPLMSPPFPPFCLPANHSDTRWEKNNTFLVHHSQHELRRVQGLDAEYAGFAHPEPLRELSCTMPLTAPLTSFAQRLSRRYCCTMLMTMLMRRGVL